MSSLKGYTKNFFGFNREYLKIYAIIILSTLFSFLLIPLFLWFGYIVNIIKLSDDEEIIDKISEKSYKELIKEGFYFTLFNIILFTIILVLFGSLSLVLTTVILSGGQLTNIGYLVFSFLFVVIFLISYLYVLSMEVSYSNVRKFNCIISRRYLKKCFYSSDFYLYSILNLVITVLSPFTLIFAPVIISYGFGILGLTKAFDSENVEGNTLDKQSKIKQGGRFKVFNVKSSREIVNKKVRRKNNNIKDLSPRDINEFVDSFEEYKDALDYIRDEPEDMVIVEVSEDKLETRLLCKECNISVKTNSDKRFEYLNRIHDSYHEAQD